MLWVTRQTFVIHDTTVQYRKQNNHQCAVLKKIVYYCKGFGLI